jgi:hypothetical protein
MTLGDLVAKIKRRSSYGDPSVTNDQITADIIHWINNRRFYIWGRYPWLWSLKNFTITLQSGVSDYNIDASIGDIIALWNANGPLKKVTLKYYLTYLQNNQSGSSVGYYIYMGIDQLTKQIKIKVAGIPDNINTLNGIGKVRINRYTISNLNDELDYFPDEFISTIEEGVLANIYEAKGEVQASIAKEKIFEDAINKMILNYNMNYDTEDTTLMNSDYYIYHNRLRGKGTIVT